MTRMDKKLREAKRRAKELSKDMQFWEANDSPSPFTPRKRGRPTTQAPSQQIPVKLNKKTSHDFSQRFSSGVPKIFKIPKHASTVEILDSDEDAPTTSVLGHRYKGKSLDKQQKQVRFEKQSHHDSRNFLEVDELSEVASSDTSDTEDDEQEQHTMIERSTRTTHTKEKKVYFDKHDKISRHTAAKRHKKVGKIAANSHIPKSLSSKELVHVKSSKKSNRTDDNETFTRTPVKEKPVSAFKAKINGFTEILELLETARDRLKDQGDAAEIEKWLKHHETADQESIKSLGEVCSDITIFVQNYQKARCSIKSYAPTETHFWRRSRDGFIEHLMVVQKFKATREVQKKTFGFVRRVGTQEPLKYAISGWTQSAEDDPRLLNTRDYNEKVIKFCEIYDHTMKRGWEIAHKEDEVSEEAGHVEKLLVMFYAMELLRSRTGEAAEIKNLSKLMKLRPHPKAEIILSWKPCEECDRFRQRMNEVTGISFDFCPSKNLGRIKKLRSKFGEGVFPVDPKDTTDEEGESEFFVKGRNKLKAAHPKAKSSKKRKKSARDNNETSDSDSDFELPASPRKLKQPATPKRKSATAILTPPSTPAHAYPKSNCSVVIPSFDGQKTTVIDSRSSRAMNISQAQQQALQKFAYEPRSTSRVPIIGMYNLPRNG